MTRTGRAPLTPKLAALVRTSAEVAVVGAGVAGLTFAAGAARRGVRVTVLEKEDRILPLFKYDPNRWLHPRVYDWPLSGWEQARAGLPVLDWTAGTVAEVRKQLEEGWRTAVAEAADRVRVTPSARVVMPGRSAESGSGSRGTRSGARTLAKSASGSWCSPSGSASKMSTIVVARAKRLPRQGDIVLSEPK